MGTYFNPSNEGYQQTVNSKNKLKKPYTCRSYSVCQIYIERNGDGPHQKTAGSQYSRIYN